MQMWFNEEERTGFRFSIQIKETLFSGQSDYQKLVIMDTVGFGRMMILDNCIMITDRDEHIYHEMISHVPLCAHPDPKKVLVIGGGDGGTIREIVRHPSVEQADLVEIDKMVVDKSKEYFPQIACELEGNSKVTVRIEDGVKYMQNRNNEYDVIIIDSTDPIGPGEGLFTVDFYRDVHRALTENGIMVAQTESPLVHHELIPRTYAHLRQAFPKVTMYTMTNLTYPGGYWSFAFATKTTEFDHLTYFDENRAAALEPCLKYYNRELHRAAFALPNYVRELAAK